jgi:hypothetical protein
MAITADFLSGLYQRHSCYADRLTQQEIDAIHIETPLERAARQWLGAKKDLVLVGNPGDGKTHLLRRLEDVMAKVRADVVLDATAESDYGRIVKRWKAARTKRRPFCLAINQGPFRQLLAQEAARWEPLGEVARQSEGLLYYGNAPARPRAVIVVDLNLRSVLSPEIIEHALANLLRPNNYTSCAEYFSDESTDGALNVRALQHPQVRSRLIRLLEIAGHTGRHITMRDLQGFLSFLVFGGRNCAELMRNPSDLRFRYFNLAFLGEGDLFDAVREVFDPVSATHPSIDEDLWEHTGLHDGWIFSRPPLTPDHYDDAWQQFEALKRQYFFEHEDGERLMGLVGDDDRQFLELLQAGSSSERFLPRVLQALNTFYCPEITEDGEALRLWGSQQYDGHSSRVLVSCYRVPRDRFVLELPKLAPWLTDAILYQPDHLLLRDAGASSTPIGLRIDRGLWRALMLAARGMPLTLRSPQYAQALRSFVTHLRKTEARVQPVESVVLYDLARNQKLQVMVDRERMHYVRP